MAAGNGFITYSPDTAYGSTYSGYGGAYGDGIDARRHSVPGSGTKEISEIGIYCYRDSGSNFDMKMALFTHDTVNNCPESMVSNSETEAIQINNTSNAKKSYSYTSTKPLVTGGDTLWIAWFANTSVTAININRKESGGVGVYALLDASAYPTWLSGNGWHSLSTSTRDASQYAVYADYTPASSLPFFSEFRGGLNNDMTGGI